MFREKNIIWKRYSNIHINCSNLNYSNQNAYFQIHIYITILQLYMIKKLYLLTESRM